MLAKNTNMEFEREIKKQGKELLHSLEQEGRYVFHGSPYVIDKLEPRQAESFNRDIDENENDGNSGVYATPYADLAIFRALINDHNCDLEYYSSFGTDDSGDLVFRVSEEALKEIENKTGYVYVLNKDDFPPSDKPELKSGLAISPLNKIEVLYADLPENIEIIK
jgi:hypothetical protein